MILTCDDCGTRYIVPDQAVGAAGRQVRCKNCGHQWFAQPDRPIDDGPTIKDLEAINEAAQPVPEGSSVPALMGDPAAVDGGRLIGYLAAVVIFIALAGALAVGRAAVVQVWPATAVFYDAVNLHVPQPAESLAIDNLAAPLARLPQGVALTIKATLRNNGATVVSLPALEIILRGEKGAILSHWQAPPPAPKLAAHQAAPFAVTYPVTAPDIKTVTIRFLPPH